MKNPNQTNSYQLPIYRYPEFHKDFNSDRRTSCIGVRPGRNNDSFWKAVKGNPIDGEAEELFEDGCIIGFDTEYQSLTDVLDDYSDDVTITKNMDKKNLCLSYQFNAKWKGIEWTGIGYPKDGARISIAEFLSWVVSSAPFNQSSSLNNEKVICPQQFVIVCHFSRADLPSFKDFFNKKFRNLLMAIRKTFVTKTKGAPIKIPLRVNGKARQVKLCIRDTILLAPSNNKSLEAISELLEIPKVKAVTKSDKMDMLGLMKRDFDLFEEYALKDAEIARKYAEKVIKISKEQGGKPQIPVTLTSLGISFLTNLWKEKGYIENEINGISPEKKLRYNTKKKKWEFFKDKSVQHPTRYIFDRFATECYHGGRNEQYIFGAGIPGEWTDYDLVSAYPTGMSRIGMPLWDEFRTSTDIHELVENDLSFAMVEFKHPDSIRFPVFPVNQGGSVAFPKEGVSFCCGPELLAAKNLGVEMVIKMGLIIPTKKDVKPYLDYITYCVEKRDQYDKKSLFNNLWKELANGMYGKLAQGLMKRTGYNIATQDYEQLPPSRITNPFFAAYTTSFCRATLTEILNALPLSVTVCSCTTDGFLSNATLEDIANATKGTLCRDYLNSGKLLRDGLEHPLEVKGTIAQPLGWRTRGQATLQKLPEGKLILAKSSFKPDADTKDEQNDWIINEFANRFYGKVYKFNALVGVREMVEKQTDLYNFDSNKRLSMDYDWKRCPIPSSITTRKICDVDHLYFETSPWKTVSDYGFVKDFWKQFAEQQQVVLKDVSTLTGFTTSFQEQLAVKPRRGRYIARQNTAVKEFKKWFALAYANGAYGLPLDGDETYMSYRKLGAFLVSLGFDGVRDALSNVKGRPADEPCVVPKTDFLVGIVNALQEKFPSFDTSQVFVRGL